MVTSPTGRIEEVAIVEQQLVKSGKAVGHDDIPAELWKCLGEVEIEF